MLSWMASCKINFHFKRKFHLNNFSYEYDLLYPVR